jgi:hypothetical protein
MVKFLIFSQSNYPLKTVIKGDSVVILLKKQADEINDIFENQKLSIINLKIKLKFKDSLLNVQDSLIEIKENNANLMGFYDTLQKRLDLLENFIYDASIRNTWIYYSWDDSLIYSVDLSQYYVRKNDLSGDIHFHKTDKIVDPYDEQESPHIGWIRDILKPKRPRVTIVPIKL